MMPVSSLSSPARGNLRPAPSAALPPLRSVRRVYFVLTFDPQGRVDTDRMHRQQRALAGLAIDAVFTQARRPREVLDAADRFVAQGGRWQPTYALAQRIDAAALGGL